MQGQVLVCHGGSDPFVTPDMMSEFQQDVQERNGDVTIHTYSDAMHAFTRPEKTLKGYVYSTLQPPLLFHLFIFFMNVGLCLLYILSKKERHACSTAP
jgi:acetyl esterase/lipase